MSTNLFENWQETKSALLEDLSAEKKAIVAPLLENQKKQMLSESASPGSTEAHNIANFRKVMLPMIRRVIPGTIATELVGVQPMEGPVSQVYTMRYLYNETVNGPAASGDGTGNPFGLPTDIAPNDEVFGNASPLRAWYSGGIGADIPAGASGFGSAGQAGLADQPPGPAFPGGHQSSQGAGTAAGQGAVFPESVLGSVSGHGGHGGPQYGGSGSFLEGSGGRSMGLQVVSQAVEASSRKLQASWTLEAMQDLNSQHGLDIEAEMTKAMSAEIVQEIDQEIITDLLALAGTVDTFDGAGAGVYGAGGNYTPAFVGDRLANVGVIINRIANEIGRKTRRGNGNFIVVSPMMVSVLQSAAKSVFAPAVDGSFKGPNNTQLVGTLNGTIKVYSYLFNQAGAGLDLGSPQAANNDTILVGYKGGNGELDSGYFYCPYIPLMSTGPIMNATNIQPTTSLMTRYGKAVFTETATSLGNSADFYGKCLVTALDLT